MAKIKSDPEKLLELARSQPLIRTSEIRDKGIANVTLSRAVKRGQIERIGRGLYRQVNAEWDENAPLAEVTAMVPQGVIVLLSALGFHQIGTHRAHAVWIQLKINAVTPRIAYPPIEIVRSSLPDAFTAGVDTHLLNGIEVRITNPARTIADCFKYRQKLGLELCLEALREIIRGPATPSEILEYAKMNKVDKLMLPYLEALS